MYIQLNTVGNKICNIITVGEGYIPLLAEGTWMAARVAAIAWSSADWGFLSSGGADFSLGGGLFQSAHNFSKLYKAVRLTASDTTAA